MRTRASNGKFSTNVVDNQKYDLDSQEKSEISSNHNIPRQSYLTAKANGTSISIPISGNGWSLLKIAVVILALSPWLFILFRKQNVETVSRKVTQFFDENFNCLPCEPCPDVFQKNDTLMGSSPNIKKGF